MGAHIFADESKRNSFVLVAAVILPGDLTKMRQLLTSLRLPGQRRLHFVAEQDSRRRHILQAFVAADVRAVIYDGAGFRDGKVARDAAVARLTADAIHLRAHRLVLELDISVAAKDRLVIREQLMKAGAPDGLVYEHLRAHEECLLSIPDAIAWSWSKAGPWRKQIEPVLAEVIVL
jgi:hypothetical protein